MPFHYAKPSLISIMKNWHKYSPHHEEAVYMAVAPKDQENSPFLRGEEEGSTQSGFSAHERRLEITMLSKAQQYFTKRRKILAILAFGITATVALIVALAVTMASHRHQGTTSAFKHGHNLGDMKNTYIMTDPCGETAAEARRRGCLFDIISFSWLPPACHDAELVAHFDAATTWEWFVDPNKTQPVTHEQAVTGEYSGLYVDWEYHLRHCTAMWLKMHRALLMGGKAAIDSYIGEVSHTKHCGEMLLENRDVGFDVINTIILRKFPHCGIA